MNPDPGVASNEVVLTHARNTLQANGFVGKRGEWQLPEWFQDQLIKVCMIIIFVQDLELIRIHGFLKGTVHRIYSEVHDPNTAMINFYGSRSAYGQRTEVGSGNLTFRDPGQVTLIRILIQLFY